jgi:hypothetical protein
MGDVPLYRPSPIASYARRTYVAHVSLFLICDTRVASARLPFSSSKMEQLSYFV